MLLLLEALEDGSGDEGQGHGGVVEDFGELAAFGGRDELAPGDGFAVRGAAESAPVDGLGADAQAVVVALEGEILAASAMAQLDVGAELLSPIAGNAAADGEDSEAGLLEIASRRSD